MKKSTDSERTALLERTLASELSALLNDVVVGMEFVISSSADICYTLELLLPAILGHRYQEWSRESIDGFFIASAKKVGATAAELIGTCILISDQTVTPFRSFFLVAPEGDSIVSYRVRVGELGGGSLGISGPVCNSKDAGLLLERLVSRINNVDWVYDVTRSAAVPHPVTKNEQEFR